MVDIDESEDEESEDDESDASSEVSDGGDLRVRSFLSPSTTTHLKINATPRTTSKMPLLGTLTLGEVSLSARLLRRHHLPVYISKGSA